MSGGYFISSELIRKAGSIVGAAVAITLVALLTPKPEPVAKPPAAPKTNEQQILDGMKDGSLPNIVWNGVLVLPEGTPVYESPVIESQTSYVQQGQAILTERPRLFSDRFHGGLWLGLVSNDKGATSGQATSAERTFWVKEQDVIDKPGYQSLAYPEYNPADNDGLDIPNVLQPGITSENNLEVFGKDGGLSYDVLATYSKLSSEMLPQLIEAKRLVPTTMDPNFTG